MKKTILRKGDEVIVIAGNDRGKRGKILFFSDARVVIEGVNIRKRHRKPTQQNQKGQIIDIECGIHISNIKPAVNGAAVKLRTRFNQQGEKELYYLESGKEVLYRSVTKS